MPKKQRNTRLEADESGHVLVNAARSYAYLTRQRFLSAHIRALATNKLNRADPAARKPAERLFDSETLGMMVSCCVWKTT